MASMQLGVVEKLEAPNFVSYEMLRLSNPNVGHKVKIQLLVQVAKELID